MKNNTHFGFTTPSLVHESLDVLFITYPTYKAATFLVKNSLNFFLVDRLNHPKDNGFILFVQFGNQLQYSQAHPDVVPLYNGNISQTFWRTASDNIMRSYGYTYDDVNRLKDALYKIPNSAVNHSYNEQVSYDLNGNITALKRYGMVESNVETIMIDDLTYEYEGNQLENVTDATTYSEGFKDGNVHSQTHQNDYEYDVNGNMVKDRNKAITEITYNHFNLPQKITFGSLGTIEYIYNSNGEKLQKKVKAGTQTHITEYLGGFQYLNGDLSFFPTAEGYVKASKLASSFSGEGGSYAYNYVYNYTDHLGNIRLRYTQDPEDQSKIRILEEDHYYPFGLKHKGYNSDHQIIASPTDPVRPNPVVIIPVTPELGDVYKYKYNGKELQDELGLDWYDYGARNYDAAIGRWMNMDPLAEMYVDISPYSYVLNNPLSFIDPTGMAVEGPPETFHGGSLDAIYLSNNSSKINSRNIKFDYGGMPNYMKETKIQERYWHSSFKGNLQEYNQKYNTDFGNHNPGDALAQYEYQNYYKPEMDQMKNAVANAGRNFMIGSYDLTADVLQDSGDALALAGYGLTLTGVGAELGIPLAAAGNTISLIGGGMDIAKSLKTNDLESAGVNSGFIIADKLVEKGLNKALPGAGKMVGEKGFNLGTELIIQNAKLKNTGANRYYNAKHK